MIAQDLLIQLKTKLSIRKFKTKQRAVLFPIQEQLNSVLIIIDDKKPFQTSLLNSFELLKKASLLTFIGSDNIQFEKGKIFKNQLDKIGIPKEIYLKDYIVEPFDAILNISDGKNKAIEYLCAVSLAKFKVGIQQNNDIYDLIIEQTEHNAQQIISEFVNAVKNLKSDSVL